MIKKILIVCGLAFAGVTWGDVVVPRAPTSIPEGKVFFGWNTKADGSGVWAEHRGRCERCGSTFQLWGSPDDFYGSCTNAGCVAAGYQGWSTDFFVFHNTVSTDFYPIFVDERYSWVTESDGVHLRYVDDADITSFSVEKLGGRPIVGVDAWAFECCESLSAVKIADSVSSIGEGAFTCTALYERQYSAVEVAGGFITADGWLLEAHGCVTNLIISAGTRGVADGWYWNLDCEALDTILLPSSLAGKAVVLPDGDFMCRDGKRFAGWNTKVDGSGAWIGSATSCCEQSQLELATIPEGGVTYYAQWVPDSWEYEYADGGYTLDWIDDRQDASTTWNVPASIGGIPVLYLGSWDDKGQGCDDCPIVDDETVLTVHIPDSVQKIGYGALEGTGAFINQYNLCGDSGIISLDGWVVKTFGEIEDLVIPEGARGIVAGWYQDLDGGVLASVKFPAAFGGKKIALPNEDWVYRDCQRLVGWNTRTDGGGDWVKLLYWCDECQDYVETSFNNKLGEYRCTQCHGWIDHDPYNRFCFAEIPEGGATYYPIFVDEEICVLTCKGFPIVADKTLRIPATLAGETIRIPCYFDCCPYSWGTEDVGARFLGWCTTADGKGEWLESNEWPLDLNDWYFDYSCRVTVPEGGLTLYAMTTPATIECVLNEDGVEISYWGEEPSGTDWAAPSTLCGAPVIAVRQSAFDGLQALDDARETAGENGIVTLGGWVLEVNGCHTNLAFAAGTRGLAYGWYECLDGESLASVKFPASMTGTMTMLPDGEWIWRDGKQFVGWNTAADGSGEWFRKKFWCESCERYVSSRSDSGECEESEYYCAICGEWLDSSEEYYQLTIPNGGQTWYAVFADDRESVSEYDGATVIFGKKTLLPSALAGTNISLPDYSEYVPYSWGDGETELRFLGWCTTADGKGEWVERTWVRSACSDEQYADYSFEVPEGGATLYAMTVPYEIDCEKVDGGIALYHWDYEIEGGTWNVPSEICGQPVVQLGGGIDWDTVVEAEDVLNIVIPDSVQLIFGATLGYTGAWSSADALVDWESNDIELKVADWTMLKWGTLTNLVFAEGTRGVATDWWDGLDCETLRTITLPASMAGTRFELPPVCGDGKKFVRWNTAPDGSGEWVEGVFACENCYKWVAPEEIDEDCESYWCCPNCHEWMEPFGEQSTLVTVPEGGVTYYAIFTDCEMNFDRTEEGLVLRWADIGDSNTFEIPAEYAGEPVVGIASECFCGYTCLSNITIPASVKWIESYAFYDTGLYNAQVEAAGDGPGLIRADGWVLEAYGDWTSLTLPAGTRGVAEGWLDEVNCEKLRSIEIPASLGGQSVSVPDSDRMYCEDGDFVAWITGYGSLGYDVPYTYYDEECGDRLMVKIPEGGLTVEALFSFERYDEDSGIGWTEYGACALITSLPVTNTDFTIPETVGGKRVYGVAEGALYDEREGMEAPISLIVPAGIDASASVDALNVWKVTLKGNGVSTNVVQLGCIWNGWAENMIGWGSSPNAANLVSTAWGWCCKCEELTELKWANGDEHEDAGWRCTDCGDCDLEDGYFTVSVPPEGATFYRVRYQSEGYFEYEECDGGVALLYVENASENYEVPSTVDGLKVVAIGEGCFAGNEQLMSVIVPDTVRWIGDYAFEDCLCLSSVKLPTGLLHIGCDVFSGTLVAKPTIAYAAETNLSSNDTERVVCTGYFAFLDGGYDDESVFAGDETSLSRPYDGMAFDIEWQYGTQYRVVATAGEHGAVSGDVDGWWPAGAELSLTAKADAHCHFTGWMGSSLDASANGEPTFALTVSKAQTLRATFEWDSYMVTFNLGVHGTRTAGGELAQTIIHGRPATAPTVTPATGYAFNGWDKLFDEVTEEMTVTALYKPLVYAITYAETKDAANANPTNYTVEQSVAFAPLADTAGWWFDGWSVTGIVAGTTGDIAVTALWERKTISGKRNDEGEDASGGGAKETPVDTSVANVYDGFLYLDDALAGSVQVKLAKVGKNGLSKATATITPATEKKITVSGNFDPAADEFVAYAKDGRELKLVIGADSISGAFGKYDIDGARSLFSSKDADDKAVVADAMAKWLGSYAMAFADDNGWNTLTVTVASKGKVKIAGTLASGTKVSISTQMIVGSGTCAIPVVWSKKDESLSFAIWLSDDGLEAVGLDDAVFGKAGNIGSDALFSLDVASLEDKIEDETTELLSDYLPEGAAIASTGKKWIVMPNEKGKAMSAGKLVWDKTAGGINETKSKIEGFNVSGLKLTFTAKTGAFRGSFKVYTVVNNKLKNTSVSVSGVVIDGVGYGTATIKKVGNFAVTIE